MRLQKYFLVLILLFSGLANGQPAYILHQPYNKQYDYIDSVRTSVFDERTREPIEKVRALEGWAHNNGDDRLYYELALVRLQREYTDEGTKEDERIRIGIADVAEYAHSHKEPLLEADALKLLGEYLCNVKKYGQAFEYDLAAYNIFSKLSYEDFPPKQAYLYVISMHYAQYGDQENAIKVLREAKVTKARNERYLNSINNAIGLYYRNEGNYDSAIWYFNMVKEVAKKRNQEEWIGIATGNIGICYFMEKKYDAAKPLLEQDIQYSLAHAQVSNAVHSMDILADIYYNEHDLSKSEQLLREALSRGRERPWWPDYKLATELYLLLSKVFAAKKEMDLAYLYSDSAIVAKDSLDARFNALSIAKAQEKADLMQRRLAIEQLNNQKQMHTLERNGLLGGIALLSVIGVLFINSQRLKQKRLKAELEVAGSELENFRQSILDKNNIIERFTNEVERVKGGTMGETDVDVLTQLQHSIILTDEQWENFRVLFEKVHKNFFINLKKKMPDLTQAEIRLLALTKLQLSSKEMASMMGISPNTIRIYKHRLRKKLELDKEELIEGLVEDI